MPLLITVALVLVRPQYWPLLVTPLVLPLALQVTSLLRHCQTVAEFASVVPQSAHLHMRYAVLVGICLVIMRIPGQ